MSDQQLMHDTLHCNVEWVVQVHSRRQEMEAIKVQQVVFHLRTILYIVLDDYIVNALAPNSSLTHIEHQRI